MITQCRAFFNWIIPCSLLQDFLCHSRPHFREGKLQWESREQKIIKDWIPAFAGMTSTEMKKFLDALRIAAGSFITKEMNKMMQIRKLKEEDIDGMELIEKISFPGTAWSKTLFLSYEDKINSLSYVLIDENRIVGYILSDLLHPEASIVKLAICPEERKKGYAKKLMNYFISELQKQNYKRIFLEVRAQNCPAHNVYEKLGFKSIGIRKKYYPDGEDAFVMEYRLVY